MIAAVVPYQIGMRYRVSCVEGTVGTLHSVWPVQGPRHEDAEFIGFADDHYHLDARFLSDRQWKHLNRLRRGGIAPFSIVMHELKQNTRLGSIETRWRKCRRDWPDYPREIVQRNWLPKLEKAYQSKMIDSRLICPHRGASLQGLQQDKHACVTCPLHGLRWDCKTGTLSTSNGETA
jgi:hypothetical protein